MVAELVAKPLLASGQQNIQAAPEALFLLAAAAVVGALAPMGRVITAVGLLPEAALAGLVMQDSVAQAALRPVLVKMVIPDRQVLNWAAGMDVAAVLPAAAVIQMRVGQMVAYTALAVAVAAKVQPMEHPVVLEHKG